MASESARRAAEAAPLVDHHVHSVVREVGDRTTLERFLTESGLPATAGHSYFDSFLGAALLRTCAPALGLAPTVGPDEYLARRKEVGGEGANRRLLRAAGVAELLVDHGYCGDDLVDLPELAELAGTPVRRIARLEQVAETVAADGVGAASFAEAFAERLNAELSGPDAAVGCKSVLAYRHGLDVDPAEPGPAQVREAAAEWLAEAGESGSLRVSHPVLLRHFVWTGLRAGVPLQFHTGYGDPDLELHRSDPSLLTGLIRRAASLDTPIMLLHCYPYHRQAAYLAGVYPHVYFDIGLAINYVGYRATAVLAEALESVPFHKMLYSSDAFGLAELHLLAAVAFRRALAEVLDPLLSREGRGEHEVARAAAMIGAGNARRVYGLTAET
ncbi:MAG TPA: amidohydrolase family protein [Acidimicrobiales bacterium]|nr:amidohydrolase family protein [Acidimicrobiales bacterium]